MLARASTGRPGARAALIVGLVAAMLPDLDSLFFRTRLEYLRYHRSWTHSFLVLPVFALLVALGARIFLRGARLANLWLFAAIGIASHILFDWITSFGTMFWAPLSWKRYSLDWVFILDPIFTGIAALSLAGAFVYRARGRRIAAIGSAALAAYIGFCALLHTRALDAWRKLDHPPEGARVAVLPQLLSPFRWLGLSQHPGSVHVAFFDIGPFARGRPHPVPPTRFSEILRGLSDFYPPPERAEIRTFAEPLDSGPLEAALRLPDVGVYLAFARFPLATLHPESGGATEITFEDLRFLPWFSGPWGRTTRKGFAREAFVYRVLLDRDLRPVEHGFIVRGRRG